MTEAARREMAQLGLAISDPFSAHDETRPRPILYGVAGVLALAVLLAWLARRRHPRIDELLHRHPERTAAFRYACGVLRHEVLKHRLVPLRSARQDLNPPVDPLGASWRRHLDALAAALGVPILLVLRHPSFAAADRAMRTLIEVERNGGVAAPPTLELLGRFDTELDGWARLGDRCAVDGPLLDRLVESLRDEHPNRRLPVAVDLAAPEPLWVSMFSHDLLLVLRNLTRNAVTVAYAMNAQAIRIDTTVYLDETGQEWVRVAIHDTSSLRPPSERAHDRGLGLVRTTLERYGGALVESQPAPGYAKALAVSLPLLECAPARELARRAA